MLSVATISLLAMAAAMAILVGVASHALLHRTIAPASRLSVRNLVPRLALSILIAAAALALFIEVADNVLDQDELARFDGHVMQAVGPLRTTTGLAAARTVSVTGTFQFMTLLAIAVVLVMHRRHWRAALAGWMLVVGAGQLVEQILKHTFHRNRPPDAMRHLVSASYSYPSGHAMGSMIGYGALAYLVLLRVQGRWARAAITALAASIILAVGTSRLVLGVHYFTDIVGGFAAGAVWLALSIAIIEAERWRLVGEASLPPAPAADGAPSA